MPRSKTPPRSEPLHLIAHSADRRTICGLKITDPKAMPYLLARWLPAHQAGRGPLDVCPECERRPPCLVAQVGRNESPTRRDIRHICGQAATMRRFLDSDG